MPRRRAHDITGAISGFGAWLVVLYFRGDLYEFIKASNANNISINGVFEIIIFIGLAVVGSRLPDLVEPPVSSKHRGVFHSLPLFLILTLLFLYWVGSDVHLLPKLTLSLIFGYDGHLILDALT